MKPTKPKRRTRKTEWGVWIQADGEMYAENILWRIKDSGLLPSHLFRMEVRRLPVRKGRKP